MAAHAAVGVNDDLAAGQSAVPHRSADHEPAGRVDEVAGIRVKQFSRNNRFNDLLDDMFFNLRMIDVGGVLG